MANNLTLTGATFAGGMMTAGYAQSPSNIYPSAPFSIAVKTRTTFDRSGNDYNLMGTEYGFSVYCSYANAVSANVYDGSSNQALTVTGTNPALNDGVLHDLVMVFDTNGTRLYIDGALIASTTTVWSGTHGTVPELGLATRSTYGGSPDAHGWNGPISQAAMYNYAFGTGSTCPSRAPLTGSETGLIAAWPLATDGSDITGQAPPPSPSGAYFYRGGIT